MIIVALFFVLSSMWIGTLLKRLPYDLGRILEHYRNHNWDEFSTELFIFILYWGIGVTVFGLFVYPVVTGILGWVV